MTTYFKFLSTLFVALIAFSSCSKSPEEKAKVLAENEIKKTLNFPDSYSLADIKTDSAFAPYDNPEAKKLLVDLSALELEYNKVMTAKTAIEDYSSIYRDLPLGGFSDYLSSTTKQKLNEAKEKEAQIEKKTKEIMTKLKTLANKKSEFIGYRSEVSYRAKDNNDQVIMSSAYFVFDREMENVLFMCSGEKYEQYKNFVDRYNSQVSKE